LFLLFIDSFLFLLSISYLRSSIFVDLFIIVDALT